MNMQGLTIREIAESLGITPQAAKVRLYNAGIQPIDHAGKTNIYAEDVADKIREVSKGGRPKKSKPD
jgi:predicted transcriptional regulator